MIVLSALPVDVRRPTRCKRIDVVTGEENEDELYAHRAKLFIFNTGEWKERGIGVVKLLKHKETGKLRVVMRREQVHKICLNHALTPDNIYKPKDEKTWLFAANDFSEGEIMLQNFCLRFQNKEVSMQFKDSIDKAIREKYGDNGHTDNSNINKDPDDDNVVFVTEIQATNEEKQKAKELMLPENFYTYKIKEPCQGCRGCNDDDDVKPEPEKFNTVKSLLKQDLAMTPLKTSTFSFQSPTNSIYGTPNVFDKTVDATIFRTPLSANGSNANATPSTSNLSLVETSDKENTLTEKSITPANPIKPVSFVGSNPSANFSSVLAAPKLVTGSTADSSTMGPKSVFGFTEQKSIFGDNKGDQQSIFGNNKGEQKSIFGDNKLGQSLNKSIFGFNPPLQNKEASQPAENKSIFSVDYKPATTNSQPLFGIFGGTGGTFTFGTASQPNQDAKSVFGQVESTSIFGDKTDTTLNKNKENIANVESTAKFSFGNNVIMQNKDSEKSVFSAKLGSETPAIAQSQQNNDVKPVIESQDTLKEKTPFKVDNALTFAALSSSGPGFAAQKKTDFKWEGAGQQLFTPSKTNEVDDKSKSDADNSGAGAGADEEYDPHYEPIVPLPDKIVVTTGEEDEEKLFGERCKLYRYDDKTREWKERGVGEMKVLYHPEKKSYRLLLRREQVHKAVLNMLIFKDLELLPMKNSDRAWTWFGCNYAESAGEQETLAVRFKSVNLATEFHEKVMDCVRKLQVAAADAIRKENEPKEQQVPIISPLRLPKHLEADARADNLLPATIQAQTSVIKEIGNISKNEVKVFEVAAESNQVESEEQEEHGDYDEDYGHGYDHNEDSDGYYNEEEESSVYYPCKAVVRTGDAQTTCDATHVQVSFDQELCSPKILVTDSNTGEILADMLIHTDTEFLLSDDTCTWTGMDYTSNVSVEKTLTITFTDTDTAMDFYDSCETSKAATYASTDSES